MEVRFGTDQLRKAYEYRKVRTKAWGEVVARLYVRRVDTLYAAENMQTLRAIASLRLHALKGDRRGKHAIDLDNVYRLILTFEGTHMTIVSVGGEQAL